MSLPREIDLAFFGKALIENHPEGDSKTTLVTAQYDSAQTLRHTESILKQFAAIDTLRFDIKSTRYGFQRIKTNVLGSQLIHMSLCDMSDVRKHFPQHEMNPYFEAFETVKNRHDVASWHDYLLRDLRFMGDEISARRFTGRLIGFFEDLKAELTSPAFKRQVNNFRRVSRKNYRSLLSYIDALFKKYSKLVVIRLDLGYRQEFCGFHEDGPMLSYDEVIGHRSLFFRSLGNHLHATISKECLVGFVWKLEFGERKSWHYHVLVLLNGQEVREDVTIARLMGEHWVSTTGNKGVYYNCNASKSRYKQLGIGLIDHANTALRDGLTKAATYITKTDYYVRMVAPGNGRTFGRGTMPKTSGKRRGRPRSTR